MNLALHRSECPVTPQGPLWAETLVGRECILWVQEYPRGYPPCGKLRQVPLIPPCYVLRFLCASLALSQEDSPLFPGETLMGVTVEGRGLGWERKRGPIPAQQITEFISTPTLDLNTHQTPLNLCSSLSEMSQCVPIL